MVAIRSAHRGGGSTGCRRITPSPKAVGFPRRLPWRRPRSTPAQRHADVARHSAREIDDLNLELVAAGAQVFFPEVVQLLRQSGQRLFPARLRLVDRPSAIGADLVGETADENLGQAIAGRPLDDDRGALHPLL